METANAELLQSLEALSAEKVGLIEKEYIATTLVRLFPRLQWTNSSELKRWAKMSLIEIVPFFSGVHAALYRVNPNDSEFLEYLGGYAPRADIPTQIRIGETAVGQVAYDLRPLLLKDAGFVQPAASMEIRTGHLAIVPLIYENRLEGVLEIAGLQPFDGRNLEVLRGVTLMLAINLYAARNFEQNTAAVVLQKNDPITTLKALFFDTLTYPLALLDKDFNIIERNNSWIESVGNYVSNLNALLDPGSGFVFELSTLVEKQPWQALQGVRNAQGEYVPAILRFWQVREGLMVALEPIENEVLALGAQSPADAQPESTLVSLLKSLLDATFAPTYIKDADNTFLYVNQPLAELIGEVQENIIGKNNQELFPPDLASVFDAKDDELRAQGFNQLTLEPTYDLQGKLRRYLSLKIPLPLGDEQKGVAGFSFDITNLPIQSFLELYEDVQEVETLRAVIDSIPDLIFILDNELKFLLANQAYKESQQHFGKTALPGELFLDSIPEHERDRWAELLDQALKGEKVVAEFNYAPYDVHVYFYPIAVRKDKTYITVFVHEISEFTQRYGELENLYNQLLSDWQETLTKQSELQKANQELTIYADKLERLIQARTIELQNAGEQLEAMHAALEKIQTSNQSALPTLPETQTIPTELKSSKQSNESMAKLEHELAGLFERLPVLGSELSYHARVQFLTLARQIIMQAPRKAHQENPYFVPDNPHMVELAHYLSGTIDLNPYIDLFSLYNAPAVTDALLSLARLRNALHQLLAY